jgi:BASS family bile acid:Na+ symporter
VRWELRREANLIKIQKVMRAGGPRNLFRNAGFILALAFAIGLSLPHGAAGTSPAVTPLLALAMTMSVMGVSPQLFLDFKKVARPILISLLLNYGVLTFGFIGLATLLIPEYELWAGFIMLDAVPAAVAVIPFTYHLEGDVDFSLLGTVASYLAALAIIPAISISFLGVSIVQPEQLLITMGQLIAIPLGVSQILRRTGIAQKLDNYRGSIVNWSFFVVVYTIVGLNRDAFLQEPLILLRIAIISFLSTFVLSAIINRIALSTGKDKPGRISLMLLGTRKNYGLAAAIALTIFSPRAAMPAAVTMVFAIGHFIWLTYRARRMAG